MTPEQYDAWYHTPRGSWIGETEYRTLHRLLAPERGASVIDVGCGTGYFTRRLARHGYRVTGVDPDAAMLGVASARRAAGERYLLANALAVPFSNDEFDSCVSVTALCFIADERGFRSFWPPARPLRRARATEGPPFRCIPRSFREQQDI